MTKQAEGLLHIWYSAKQAVLVRRDLDGKMYYARLEDGHSVAFTESTEEKKPSSTWDDYVYLGRGYWITNR